MKWLIFSIFVAAVQACCELKYLVPERINIAAECAMLLWDTLSNSLCAPADCISKEDLCDLDPDRGGCSSFTQMFYFNRFTGQCHEFVFNGCLGNKNQFETKEECQTFCEGMALDKKPHCNKMADKGPCEGWMIRYYYDADVKHCKYFEYGGCRGNANNFASYEECMDTCYEE